MAVTAAVSCGVNWYVDLCGDCEVKTGEVALAVVVVVFGNVNVVACC